MKKAEFTHELESRLNGMKQDEIESSVKSCTQTIDMMMFTGMTEDEAVALLGNIDVLASKIRPDKGYTDTQHYQMENGSSAYANNNYNDNYNDNYNESYSQKSDFEQQQYYKKQAYYQQQAINRVENQKTGVIIFLIVMIFLMPLWFPFALVLFLLLLLMYLLPVIVFFGGAFTGIVGIINVITDSAGYGLFISGIGLMTTGFSILVFMIAVKLTALFWKLLCSIFDKLTKDKTERRNTV